MMSVKYDVYTKDGDYLFGGLTDAPMFYSEDADEVLALGSTRPRMLHRFQCLKFDVSNEMYEVFKRHTGHNVIVKIFSERAEAKAHGYIDTEYGNVILSHVTYDIKYKRTKKDELLAQLDELKRKIEEALC